MRIAVVGTGALGDFYGGMLARQGYDVHFLLRSDYEVVRQKGLTVRSRQGDFHLEEVQCYRRPDDIGPVDLVFVGLKTTANQWYEELIGPLMREDGLVLTAQNGLGNEEQLAELFGPERVAGALAFVCCNRVAPGVIEHLDYGAIHLGNYGRGPDERLRRFCDMLNDSRVECKVIEELALGRWKKLVWNVPFNGLSTLLDRMVNEIMADEGLRAWSHLLMEEVQAGARAQGLMIGDDFLEEMIADTDRMKPYYTSMHLDRRHRQPMEVESIIGEPLRRGQQRGAAMPAMAELYAQLKTLDEAQKHG